jgi:hypothetical protein
MMFLHFGKVPKIRSNLKNRQGYALFRVLTSSYHYVNMPGFPLIFTRFHQSDERIGRVAVA